MKLAGQLLTPPRTSLPDCVVHKQDQHVNALIAAGYFGADWDVESGGLRGVTEVVVRPGNPSLISVPLRRVDVWPLGVRYDCSWPQLLQ